jgi:hypothetical protein
MLRPPILRHETTRPSAFRGFGRPDRRGTTDGLSSRRAQPDTRQQLIDFRGSIPYSALMAAPPVSGERPLRWARKHKDHETPRAQTLPWLVRRLVLLHGPCSRSCCGHRPDRVSLPSCHWRGLQFCRCRDRFSFRAHSQDSEDRKQLVSQQDRRAQSDDCSDDSTLHFFRAIGSVDSVSGTASRSLWRSTPSQARPRQRPTKRGWTTRCTP